MRNIPKIPYLAPITVGDVEVVKEYLKDAIQNEVENELSGQPFICTLSLDWQSEDRHIIQRVARFDISYINGEFIESEAVPPEQKEDRIIISQTFELLATCIIAEAKDWLNVPKKELLRSILEKHEYDRDTFVLWEGCGAMFITFLSNADGDSNERVMHNDTFCRLKDEYGPFKDCRENDEEWMEQHNYEWRIKPL